MCAVKMSLPPDREGAKLVLGWMHRAATTLTLGSKAALLMVGRPERMCLLTQCNMMYKAPPLA